MSRFFRAPRFGLRRRPMFLHLHFAIFSSRRFFSLTPCLVNQQAAIKKPPFSKHAHGQAPFCFFRPLFPSKRVLRSRWHRFFKTCSVFRVFSPNHVIFVIFIYDSLIDTMAGTILNTSFLMATCAWLTIPGTPFQFPLIHSLTTDEVGFSII